MKIFNLIGFILMSILTIYVVVSFFTLQKGFNLPMWGQIVLALVLLIVVLNQFRVKNKVMGAISIVGLIIIVASILVTAIY
ncbi:hypothetical protein [Kurthia huakuii]|uniref:hypothetical protein n=1 Tax=Kurthia huakuii TaxID=1421019 RepID=UPI0004955355|nr:hypothetical protein [Kurthia huakuii]MBM7699473.1 cellulose synthase/poly-beta-1,6-N-acetylglucosamine synthase-like glycosyltransferase [Kurthia huakuii]